MKAMALNSFDLQTTRRLAISLLAASGALLFAALDLIGAGISADDRAYAAKISEALAPLSISLLSGMFAFIATEVAAHKSTPEDGHPHSKRNYLETAFALLAVNGLCFLLFGGFRLISAAAIS